MANHKSSKKRIRANDHKRVENKYYAKTMRNALKDYRLTTEKEAAASKVAQVTSLIDKLAKKGIIHANKAANLKSGMMLKLSKM
ncbi:MAG: 30S ribosomal protein S20 [Bacteroidales bacterium]|jgi:small subunit ribosomal protein S20|nr:30S ribosomal protein S20 [Bacteroidales bacterium]